MADTKGTAPLNAIVCTLKMDGTTAITDYDREPDIAFLQMLKDQIGGGYIEPVPGWNRFYYDGRWHRCVAFCDDDGKRKFELNEAATVLWARALVAEGKPGLVRPGGVLADYLVGDIVIVMGDDEFMDNL